MARSKRRCAVSWHEVAKWTLPSRVSASSWPNAGCPHEMQAVVATVMAAADHWPNFDVIAELPCLATFQDKRADRRTCKGVCRRYPLCEVISVLKQRLLAEIENVGTPFASNGSVASKSRSHVVLLQ